MVLIGLTAYQASPLLLPTLDARPRTQNFVRIVHVISQILIEFGLRVLDLVGIWHGTWSTVYLASLLRRWVLVLGELDFLPLKINFTVVRC
jgi:hypothetical protein